MCKKKELNRKPEFFYNTVEGNQLDTNNVKQKIQLIISLTGCSTNSSYSVNLITYSGSNHPNRSIQGQTETSTGMVPTLKFNKFFIMDYYFEKEQHLGYEIIKDNAHNHMINITLGRIMGSRGLVYSTDVSNGGKLIIQAKSLVDNPFSGVIEISLNGEPDNIPLNYLIRNLGTESSPSNTMIYRSEIKQSMEKIAFNPVTIPTQYLCNGDTENALVLIEIIQNGQDKIGELSGTFNQLIVKPSTIKLNVNSITATIKLRLKLEYNFLDFLRGGLQIGLTIAIDFTGSNKDPMDPRSLHNITNNQMNQYENAIKSCGEIVAYYDYDQLFPVYGYGAILPGCGDVSHCFPLNGTMDPNIHTINAVLACYRAIVPTLKFYGPTFFSPIIKALNNAVKADISQGKQMNYNILMILTDGQINDMQDTIDAVVEASFLPISIIIIGIGIADFGNMDVLDGDDTNLYDKNKRKAARDIVQFVPFHQFQNDGQKLAEKVLEEVPGQVVKYYELNKIIPGDPIIDIA